MKNITKKIEELQNIIPELKSYLSIREKELETLIRSTMDEEVCMNCGHQWHPRTLNPPTCPNCRSPDWRFPRPKYTCKACNHEWRPHQDHIPTNCPKCKKAITPKRE